MVASVKLQIPPSSTRVEIPAPYSKEKEEEKKRKKRVEENSLNLLFLKFVGCFWGFWESSERLLRVNVDVLIVIFFFFFPSVFLFLLLLPQ
jgi:hypothetical protein